MTREEIASAVYAVQEAQKELFVSQESDQAALYALEDAKAQAIIDGTISGKNAEEREAKAVQVLQPFIEQQRITAAKVKHAKMLLDRAVMDWECIKYTIRLMEVQA